MEENSQAFNELNDLAHEILTEIKVEFSRSQSELASAQNELKQLQDNDRNISAELAKSQEARNQLESELIYLREEVSNLNTSNQKLLNSLQETQASLRDTQTSLRDAKAELITMRNKVAQAQRILAGCE